MRIARVVFAFAVAMAFAIPAHAELLITIDRSSQRMTVDVDGNTRYVWPVSTGAPGYDTPSGQYKPFRMEADHFSKEWDDAPMPHSIFFTMQGHAIHGSTHLKAIGTPASHGCVRLEPKNAAVLFDLVKQQKMANTRVVLTGETPVARGAPVARQQQQQNRDTDRTYRRTYSNDNYGPNDNYGRDIYGRTYSNNGYDDGDVTASVPQRRARQGRIIRDEYGRQFLVYDDLPPRITYDRDSNYAPSRRYSDQPPFGWPFGR
jgi:hypothetical protein